MSRWCGVAAPYGDRRATVIEFVVMRHGQSLGDVEDVHEGRADLPLTDLGREQGRLAAEWIVAHLPLDVLYSSPLRRAAETAGMLSARLQLPVAYEDDLMEFDNGLLAGLTSAEAAERYPEPVGGHSPHETVPGGECDITFRARAELVWSRILYAAVPGQRVGIIAHGGLISRLFQCFLGLPAVSEVRLVTGDTGIHLWRVEGDRRYVLFTNRSDHLDRADSARNW